MKMTMDKEFTPVSRVKETRENMKEFKARHTEKDLLNALVSILESNGKYCMGLGFESVRILSCDVEAWYSSPEESRFWVKMDVATLLGYYRIGFFTSIDLEINTNKNMISVEYYKRDCDIAD